MWRDVELRIFLVLAGELHFGRTAERMAASKTVSVEDLAAEEVALLPSSTPPAIYDLLIPPRALRAPDPPHPAGTDHQRDPLLRGPGPDRPPNQPGRPIFNRDDIVLVPFADLPPLPLGLVWCTSRENIRIRALDETARTMAAASGAARPPRARRSGARTR